MKTNLKNPGKPDTFVLTKSYYVYMELFALLYYAKIQHDSEWDEDMKHWKFSRAKSYPELR